MLRMGIPICVALLSVPTLAADKKPSSAIFVSNADVQSTLKKSPQTTGSDQPIRVVDMAGLGYHLGIGVVHRPKGSPPTAPVEHDDVTEIYHVIRGSGDLITGGALIDAKPRPADSANVVKVNGPSQTGSSIRGGQRRRVSDGDVIIIPAGVPHWFSEIQESLTYLVVRVDPQKRIQLK